MRSSFCARCVSLCWGVVTGATSRVPLSVSLSPDVSVRIAGDLGVSGSIPLSLWVTVTLSLLSQSRSPFSP